MATISMQCPDCSAPLTANVGESHIDGKLRWYQSYRCSSCGNATELDDIGFPPDSIRAALIDELGYWQVVVVDANEKSKAVQVIRNALALSLVDAKNLIAIFPRVYAGTKVECAWLKSVLEQSGIAANVIDSGAVTMNFAKEER